MGDGALAAWGKAATASPHLPGGCEGLRDLPQNGPHTLGSLGLPPLGTFSSVGLHWPLIGSWTHLVPPDTAAENVLDYWIHMVILYQDIYDTLHTPDTFQ